MEGLKFVFSQCGPYFSLILFLMVKALLTGIMVKISSIGILLGLLLNFIFFMFTPFCVIYIILGIQLNPNKMMDYFKEAKKLNNSTFIKRILKSIFSFFLIILLGIVIYYSIKILPDVYADLGGYLVINAEGEWKMLSNRYTFSNAQLFGMSFLYAIVFLYFTLSEIYKVMIYGVSCLYEDYEFKFIKDNYTKYKFDFLWTLVPIIGLFAGFVLPTMIAIDMKKYYNL